jgi:hypothetical protein
MEGIGNTKGYYWYSNDICMFKIKKNEAARTIMCHFLLCFHRIDKQGNISKVADIISNQQG